MMQSKGAISETDAQTFLRVAEMNGVSEERALEYLSERARRDRRKGYSFLPTAENLGNPFESLHRLLNRDYWAEEDVLSVLYDRHILHRQDADVFTDDDEPRDEVESFLHSLESSFPKVYNYLRSKKRNEDGRIVWDEKIQDLGFVVGIIGGTRIKLYEYHAAFFAKKSGKPMTTRSLEKGASAIRNHAEPSTHISALFD